MVAPEGGNGAIAGQASLIGLDGWTVEEMWIDPGAAMVVNFPSLGGGGGRGGRRGGGVGRGGWSAQVERYEAAVNQLDEWMDAGRHYSQAVESGAEIARDLKLEAMSKMVSREMPVLLSANGLRDITNAVEWAMRQEIDYVITGGREAWKIAGFLAENEVDLILSATQSMPSGLDEAYDEAYANAGKLYAAGVKIAFATFNSADSRTLPYEAAMAVPYGLPLDAALDAVTKNAAEMLGLDDRIGTIEVGKLANIIVTDGNPLEIRMQVTNLFILGRSVSTDNKHQSLYEKYRSRPRG